MGITATAWASAFIAIKMAVPETGPLWLATWRVLLGFAFLLPYALWLGLKLPTTPKLWALITVAAIFNVVFPFFLISWSEQTIDAGVAALLMGTGPFLALIGSHFTTSDDRITPIKSLAVAFGFAGVFTIVGVDAFAGLGGDHLLSQLAALGGAVCYAISGLLVRRINLPAISLGCLIFGIGLIMLLILAFSIDGPPVTDVSNQTFWAVLYLGLVPTAIGQILRLQLIKKIGYAAFSMVLNLIPVIGVVLGALVLGEVITPRVFIAVALVLTGLIITRLDRPKKS